MHFIERHKGEEDGLFVLRTQIIRASNSISKDCRLNLLLSCLPRLQMEDYYRRNYIPAFGSWNWNDDLPFTQCFESSAKGGFLRYNYSGDRDLYVAGDLCENDVVAPAMILVPRSETKREREVEERKKGSWVVDVKKPPSPIASLPRTAPKPVDQDLYKISPTLLHNKPRKKGGLRLFAGCFLPTCG